MPRGDPFRNSSLHLCAPSHLTLSTGLIISLEMPWRRTAFSRASRACKTARLQPLQMDSFSNRTFFVTSVTWERRPIFRSERAARLFLDSLFNYRDRHIFQLYSFVLMPDHLHLLLAPKPTIAVERAMQFIKGGYSYRFMKETGSRMEI